MSLSPWNGSPTPRLSLLQEIAVGMKRVFAGTGWTSGSSRASRTDVKGVPSLLATSMGCVLKSESLESEVGRDG